MLKNGFYVACGETSSCPSRWNQTFQKNNTKRNIIQYLWSDVVVPRAYTIEFPALLLVVVEYATRAIPKIPTVYVLHTLRKPDIFTCLFPITHCFSHIIIVYHRLHTVCLFWKEMTCVLFVNSKWMFASINETFHI